MLVTSELGQKIKESRENFSRRKFEDFSINGKLGLREKCPERCILHNHGVVSSTQQSKFLETLSEVDTRQGLPPIKIIKLALTSLQSYEVMINV